MMFFVIFLSSRFCILIYTLILLKIMNNPVLYFISFSKMKTAPVMKRLDCLMRQDQKVLFISFVVFAEQSTTDSAFYLIMILFDKKLLLKQIHP